MFNPKKAEKFAKDLVRTWEDRGEYGLRPPDRQAWVDRRDAMAPGAMDVLRLHPFQRFEIDPDRFHHPWNEVQPGPGWNNLGEGLLTPRKSQAAEERVLLAHLAGPYWGEWWAQRAEQQLLDAYIPDYRKGDKDFGDPDSIRAVGRYTHVPKLR